MVQKQTPASVDGDELIAQAKELVTQGDEDAACVLLEGQTEDWLQQMKRLSKDDVKKRQMKAAVTKALSYLENLKSSKKHQQAKLRQQVSVANSKSSELTAAEIEVLRHTSKIAGNTLYPWIPSDGEIASNSILDAKFTDPDGLVPLAPVHKRHNAVWRRPCDVFAPNELRMIVAVSALSITQTVISDCSFVSAISVAAHFERRFKKRLITGIIYPQNRAGQPICSMTGKYVVKLHLNGKGNNGMRQSSYCSELTPYE